MRWILILLLLILTGLQSRLWTGPGSWAHIASLERELDAQIRVNARLQQRNQTLENDIESLKKGLKGVEERARTELGMIKPDETFFLLIDEKK